MNILHQTEPLFLRITREAKIFKDAVRFSAVEINPETWNRVDAKTHFLVDVTDPDIEGYINELGKGAVCKLYPKTLLQDSVQLDGVILNRKLVTCNNFILLRTSGKLIVELLSKSTKFKGIGQMKAQKLWNYFGGDLYQILDLGNRERLLEVVNNDIADSLVRAWQSYVNTDAMVFCCYKLKLPVSQAFKISRYYKKDTKGKITEDPYRLLAFNVNFKTCDEIAAQNQIALDDNKRLGAAVEEALYQVLDIGDSVSNFDAMFSRVKDILQDEELAEHALASEFDQNNFSILPNRMFQSNGAFVMEQYVASRVYDLLQNQKDNDFSIRDLDKELNSYEKGRGLYLAEKQRLAIECAMKHSFCLINGGAGVGKTTVLDALYHVFDKSKLIPVQVALSAKAASRMNEATGRDAYTIARFIKKFNFELFEPSRVVLAVDESSMVDLPNMYRLLDFIPESVRVILVGDIGQLPPIGFGLILKELISIEQIPSVTLEEVKRQEYGSNIPAVSCQIRNGIVPKLNFQDVYLIQAMNRKALEKQIISLYEEYSSQGELQIICATKSLVSSINSKCAALNMSDELLAFNEIHDRYEDTGFRLNDKVICTANLYAYEVLNGSTGSIYKTYSETRKVEIDKNGKRKEVDSYGQIEWEGSLITEITDDILDHLEHSYAMTIHKAQGSQFDTVIIPLVKTKNMDRAMLYTAISRAKSKVIFVGDESVAAEAVKKVHINNRQADLANKIQILLAS